MSPRGDAPSVGSGGREGGGTPELGLTHVVHVPVGPQHDCSPLMDAAVQV